MTFNFQTAHPRANLMNWGNISKGVKEIFANEEESEQKILDILDYECYQGNMSTRYHLSEFFNKEYGGRFEFKSNQFILQDGVSGCIHSIASIKYRENSYIVIEDPTYYLVRGILPKNSKKLPIKVEKDGINISKLEELLDKGVDVSIVYIIPFFQNPTSYNLSVEKIKKLIYLSKKFDFVIISDEVYSQIYFDNEFIKNTLPLACYDTEEPYSVYSVNSVSKTLSPGLRLGWIFAKNDAIEDLLKDMGNLSSGGGLGAISAQILQNLLEKGEYEKQIHKIRKVYKEQLDFICNKISESSLSKFLKFDKPNGGYFLWCEVIESLLIKDTKHLLGLLNNNNVLVLKGSSCSSPSTNWNDSLVEFNDFSNCFRLCFVHLNCDQISEGIDIMEKIFLENSK
eukprot:TRINITY_DN6748_c0_g1_i1.p1 TRINITY_DN6748_c0_g1~~TRINITY_DN6748_c0_g1_i1.p1  ORF type:complete len:398 (+),score=72.03 TRINITY_DN6748_c0_g1_i1:1-1194(+)